MCGRRMDEKRKEKIISPFRSAPDRLTYTLERISTT
jgi:hypothetical protein